MSSLQHKLDRAVTIQAPLETVFRFFTDDARWAAWWGAGSTIDARLGGRVYIRHPGGVEVSGEVLDIRPPSRIVFSYGYVAGHPIAPGGSRVSIQLEPDGAATRLHLTHEFDDIQPRDEHVQGWRYQLSLFANLVANEAHARAADVVDAWFTAWSEPDALAREAVLARVVNDEVQFRDQFSDITGLPDLLQQLAAVQRFMPGIRMRRAGDVRHCQGTVLAEWVANTADGGERGRGTNVFVLSATGVIDSVTGFWDVPKRA
jgi:uncharacterized protein YndB with AHSA1/START domain